MKHYIGAGNPMRAQFDARAPYQAKHFAWNCDANGVGTVSLNRPERKNPLTFDSYAELRDYVTGVLKDRMDFGGFVVSDWNAHGQVAGCTNEACPQALMAGVDMYMAPDTWKPIWNDLLARAKSGAIPMSRIDEGVARIRPALEALAPAPDRGWGHMGPTGSGHYVKMVHNGIEYGMMQAMAEGFALFASARNEVVAEDYRYDLDLAAIAEVWRRGSVVSSWLLDLGADALAANPSLDLYSAEVAESGEGRWTVEAAIDQRTSAQVLAAALFARFASRDADQLGNRFLSALRNKFGGHPSLSTKG